MIAVSQAAPDEGMRSHRGRVRALNEDSYGSFRSVFDGLDTPGHDELLRRKGWLYVVADGMGGHDHGDVASATAVQQICAAYYSAPDDDPAAGLRAAIAQANAAIYAAAQANSRPGKRPMGTTVVCAVIHGAQLTLAHVGDSRAYRLRAGRLEQLTADHDWATEQMRAQGLSREEAQRQLQQRGRRGALLRAVGVQASTQPDLATYNWRPDDVLLLCTDGLHGLVSDDAIGAILANRPAPLAARELIAAANAAGGHDNSTALVVHGRAPATTLRRRPPWLQVGRALACVAAGLLVLFGLTVRAADGQPGVIPNSVLELADLPTLAATVALLPTATPSPTATSTPTPTATPTATPTPTPRPTSRPRPTAPRPTATRPSLPKPSAPAPEAPTPVPPTLAPPSPPPPTDIPAATHAPPPPTEAATDAPPPPTEAPPAPPEAPPSAAPTTEANPPAPTEAPAQPTSPPPTLDPGS
jgi:protein phosphatase